MTIDERTTEVMRSILHSNEPVFDLIKNAIAAAVAEEREACAGLIDKQIRGMDVLIDHAPTPLRAEDLKRLQHSLSVAAACVRTREVSD